MIEVDDYIEYETCCPYSEREWCDGCPRYITEEDLCDMELPMINM